MYLNNTKSPATCKVSREDHQHNRHHFHGQNSYESGNFEKEAHLHYLRSSELAKFAHQSAFQDDDLFIHCPSFVEHIKSQVYIDATSRTSCPARTSASRHQLPENVLMTPEPQEVCIWHTCRNIAASKRHCPQMGFSLTSRPSGSESLQRIHECQLLANSSGKRAS